MSPLNARLQLAAITGLLLISLSGCKAKPADDATIAQAVQAQLAADSAIAGQPIHASTANAVVTLSGSVANDAQRSIAARDAAGVTGVREVVNNMVVGPVLGAAVAVPPTAIAPVPAPTNNALLPAKPRDTSRQPLPPVVDHRHPAPVERRNGDENANNQTSNQPVRTANQAPVQQAPPPPPQPVFRNVTVAAATSLPVRVTQTLDSATTQLGATFSGVTTSDVISDGLVAIPAGSTVTGRVDAVQEAAHFKGSSLLTVSLTEVRRKGDRIAIATEPYTVEGKGRGKNTAIKTGGGAAVGAVLGGIFGGGKGAAIGAASGAGVGAGVNAVTRGEQVQIPSETVVRFRLTTPISVRVRTDSAAPNDNYNTNDPTLQRRPQ